MNIMKISDLQKSYGEHSILNNLMLEIQSGDRIGLVGYNGTGKTTLMNILAGKLKADSGNIDTFGRHISVGYLEQSIEYKLMDFQSIIREDHTSGILETTSKLGLEKAQNWEAERLSHLSGGEKLKLILSKVWASKPQLLLLDEPTNHLDLQGVRWLIHELEQYEGTVIIISHDRYFLDETVNRIEELSEGKLESYTGNYTAYREEKKRRQELQQQKYENQQKNKQKIESQMENLKNWSEKAHRDSTKKGSPSERRQIGFKEFHRAKAKKMDIQIRSKMTRLTAELEKNKIEKPEDDVKLLFEFENGGKRGKRIYEMAGAGKKAGHRWLFQESHFYVKYGERVGIFGPNGCGKTTLVKVLLGNENLTEGTFWKSDSLKIGYLSQDVTDLKENETPIEALKLEERDDILKLKTICAGLGMKADTLNKKIGELSLGQRTRMKLAGMLLKKADVLILDEPTNHLDLPSREKLEETLKDFTGSILIVSHDYYFMNKLADRLLVFEEGTIRRYEHGLKSYESKKEVNKNENSKQTHKEELLVLETKISAVLGELSMLLAGDPKYKELDKQFAELTSAKKILLKEMKNG
ncbi:ribosomal protection-like ABC-F family protein [Metabacillus sp. RGM 3146]|uniref:ribosomal protection-like ABC-F family protein n=1 Tax=Metabacillus sp. RGM 3146 TaxID=3401092 RepID=UPI003B9BF1DF